MESLGVMVGDLPPKYREALTLTLYEGLTQQEVAGPPGDLGVRREVARAARPSHAQG